MTIRWPAKGFGSCWFLSEGWGFGEGRLSAPTPYPLSTQREGRKGLPVRCAESAMKARIPFDRSKWAELAIVALALAGLAIVAWRYAGAAGPPFFVGYIAASVAIG